MNESSVETKKLTLLVADDHQLFIDGVTLILKDQVNLQIVDQALNGREVLNALYRHTIDILLLDVNMPETRITELLTDIKKTFPQTKVIILTMDISVVSYMKLLKYGIDGYMSKTEDKTQFIEAIQTVSSGGQFVSKKVLENLSALKTALPPASSNIEYILTASEIRVLKLTVLGYASSKVADTLFIAKGTVDTHLKNIKAKLNVSNKTELILACLQYGILHE
jgi:DNA-binding NarL/FixJ family response regulator